MTRQQQQMCGETSRETAVEIDRRLLLNVAYRLLGSVTDAEDAVQEACARWYARSPQARAAVGSPSAWLVTVVSRICLDVLGSARVRRERYVGQWLPEPVPAGAPWTSHAASGRTTDPAEQAALADSLRTAVLVVLELLTPAERVAFVLHDVFGYPFTEIGRVLGRSPQACRQLAAAARRRVRAGAPARGAGSADAQAVTAFRAAWEAGDVAGLVRVLDPDAVAVTDGGGLVSAAVDPVPGAAAVARFLVDVFARRPELTVREAVVNGAPGLVAEESGTTVTVISLRVSGGRIDRVWVVRNPDKLSAWGAPDRAQW
jgi:RNA polymerase sigma-70 factor (ECF subfamily)